MRLFCSLLAACYIFLIFFLADSPMINHFNAFNPYSLWHIPLYSLLTVLLFFSVRHPQKPSTKLSYILTALIAGVVGVLDEGYQSFLSNREASGGDVLLDLGGIFLGLLGSERLYAIWRNFVRRKGKMTDFP